MILGLVILFNSILAFVGFKKGLYAMFATLFNQLFAVFIAVLSTPKILSMSPGFERTEYYAGMILFLTYVFVFGVLQFFAWFYLLRNREDYFPVFIDKVFAVVFGFICGHLISSMIFVSLCVGLGALTDTEQFKTFGSRQDLQKVTVPGLIKACNFLAWYSLECFDGDSEASLDYLLSINSQQDKETVSPHLPEIEQNSLLPLPE